MHIPALPSPAPCTRYWHAYYSSLGAAWAQGGVQAQATRAAKDKEAGLHANSPRTADSPQDPQGKEAALLVARQAAAAVLGLPVWVPEPEQ